MEKIKGIIPAMGTPVTAGEEVDRQGLRNMTRYFIDGGVHGLFALGSMGGCGFFAPEQTEEIIAAVVEENDGRLPVLAGIADTATGLVIKRGNLARKSGADAVVLAPPYYFNYTKEQLVLHYKTVVEEVGLPLYIYNNPGYTGLRFSPQLVRELSKINNIVGIKDSGSNFSETVALINEFADRNDFAIYSGDERCFGEAIAWGADGAVIGTNFDPRLLVAIYEAGRTRNTEKLIKLQYRMDELMEIQFFGDLFAGYHYAFKLLDIAGEYAMRPVRRLNTEQKQAIEEIMNKHGLI